MKKLLPQFLALVSAGLMLAGTARAQGLPGSSEVSYNPVVKIAQGNQPFMLTTQVTSTVTVPGYNLSITSPSNLVPGTPITVSIQFIVLAEPANVDDDTALSFVSASPNTLTFTQPGQTLSTTINESVPIGNFSGNYEYLVVTSGWPDVLGIADNGATINTTVNPPTTVNNSPPQVAIHSPTDDTKYIYYPVTGTPVSIPVIFEGTVGPGGDPITSMIGTINNSPVSVTTSNLNTLDATSTTTYKTTIPGIYTISGTAVNKDGSSTATVDVEVIVSAPPPTITVTNPVSSPAYVFTYGGSVSVPVTFSATSQYGNIDTISATLDGSPVTLTSTSGVGTATTASGAVSLSYSSPGVHTLVFNATNDYGAAVPKTVTFTVNGVYPVPTVVIDTPADGAVIAAPPGLLGLPGTATVPYTFHGGTSYGNIVSATVLVNGLPQLLPLPTVNGLNTPGITGGGTLSLLPGTYTITVTDSNGGAMATDTTTFTVVASQPPTVGVTTDASNYVIPVGASSVQVKYAVSGGTTYGTIQSADLTLNAGEVAAVFSGLNTAALTSNGILNVTTPGTYTLVATDANDIDSATAQTTFTVVAAKPPTVAVSTSSSSYLIPAGSSSVSVPYTVTGGTTYQKITSASLTLNGSTVSASFSGINSASIGASGNLSITAPGTYTLVATDNNGAASATAQTTFTVLQAAPPTIAISKPVASPSYTIPAGSSSVSVPYSITGGTTYQTIVSASATLNGSAISIPFSGLNSGSISASGNLTISTPGTYTLVATDSNGAASATSQVVFTVVQATAPPTITITKPANNATFNIPATSSSVSVPFTITGGTTSGKITSASVKLNGSTVTTSITGLNTAAITGNGTLTITAAGTYTLSATDSNGVGTANASVTFTVTKTPPQVNQSLCWLQPISCNQTICGGVCVPIAFSLSTPNSGKCGSGSTFIKDTSTIVAIYEIYSNCTSSAPLMYTYSSSCDGNVWNCGHYSSNWCNTTTRNCGSNWSYCASSNCGQTGYTVYNNSYDLSFQTASGTHHYRIEVYHPLTADGKTLQLLGSKEFYTGNCNNSCSNNNDSSHNNNNNNNCW